MGCEVFGFKCLVKIGKVVNSLLTGETQTERKKGI